jgi:hypothetical protein
VPYADQDLFRYNFTDDPAAEDGLAFLKDGEATPFSEMLSAPFSILSGPLENIAKSRIAQGEAASFLQIITSYIVWLIITIAVFIILLILVRILIAILFYFLRKLVTGSYAGHLFDKLMGGVLGMAIIAIFVFGFLAVVQLLGNYPFILPMQSAIENSTVTKMLYDNNILYDAIANSLNVQGFIDNIMSAIGQ